MNRSLVRRVLILRGLSFRKRLKDLKGGGEKTQGGIDGLRGWIEEGRRTLFW